MKQTNKSDSAMKNRSKHLLQLAMAQQAFQEAHAMGAHILECKLNPESHLYCACVAGLVTCYCRPFLSANGLAPLSKEFQNFAGSESPADFAQMHLDMWVARNKLHAHFDLNYGEAEFHAERYILHPGEIELQLRLDGYELCTNHTTLPLHRVQLATGLVAYQQERVWKQLSGFAVSTLKETGGKLGSYIFPEKRGA